MTVWVIRRYKQWRDTRVLRGPLEPRTKEWKRVVSLMSQGHSKAEIQRQVPRATAHYLKKHYLTLASDPSYTKPPAKPVELVLRPGCPEWLVVVALLSEGKSKTEITKTIPMATPYRLHLHRKQLAKEAGLGNRRAGTKLVPGTKEWNVVVRMLAAGRSKAEIKKAVPRATPHFLTKHQEDLVADTIFGSSDMFDLSPGEKVHVASGKGYIDGR